MAGFRVTPLEDFTQALSEDAQGRVTSEPEEVSDSIWEFRVYFKGKHLLVTVEDIS